MKHYIIFNGTALLARVSSERVYSSPEGRLSFFNVSTNSNVAGFAAGSWTHFTTEDTPAST